MRGLKSVCLLVMLSVLFGALPVKAASGLNHQWLVGLTGGYATQRARLTSSLDYTQNALPPGLFKTYFRNNLNGNSPVYGLLGGIQFSCRDWLMGFELAVLDGYDLDQTTGFVIADRFGARGWHGLATYDKGVSVSATVRGGYWVVRDLMPYVRLGLETSRDKLNVTFSGTPAYPVSLTTQDRKQIYRYVAGLGVEAKFRQLSKIRFRLEYNLFSTGQDLEIQGLMVDNAANPYFISESHAKYHVWQLGVIWLLG